MKLDEFASKTYERALKPHHPNIRGVRVYKGQDTRVGRDGKILTAVQVEREGLLLYDWTYFRSHEEAEIFSAEIHYTISKALDVANNRATDEETAHHHTKYQLRGKWLFENGEEEEPGPKTLSALINSTMKILPNPAENFKLLLSGNLKEKIEGMHR